MKVCLFGGSFDPVHSGHLAIAAAAQHECGLDEVVFLPAACSPFKVENRSFFSDAQRVDMLRLATQNLSWARVSSLDLELPPPSWSWRVAEIWLEQHPGVELYWLMGTDQWEQLHRWARYDYLCSMLHFIVYHRESPPVPREGVRSTFICSGLHPASSSAIREALREHRAIPAGWLPPPVAEYLARS